MPQDIAAAVDRLVPFRERGRRTDESSAVLRGAVEPGPSDLQTALLGEADRGDAHAAYQYFRLHHCQKKLDWIRHEVQLQWRRVLRQQSQRHRLHWSYLATREWFKLPLPPRRSLHLRSEEASLAKALWGSPLREIRTMGSALRSYPRYYKKVKTHRSLDKDAPISRPVFNAAERATVR